MAALNNKAECSMLVIKWSGKEYAIDGITSSVTVADLKEMIAKKTNVLPGRQKLLGLKYKGTFSLFAT